MPAYKVFYDFNFKPGLQILPEAHFDFGYLTSYGLYTWINICANVMTNIVASNCWIALNVHVAEHC